jgi:hypothetical protein
VNRRGKPVLGIAPAGQQLTIARSRFPATGRLPVCGVGGSTDTATVDSEIQFGLNKKTPPLDIANDAVQ